MANKVRITYFGMDGEGKNVTEAKKDAGRKIERALAGDYYPVLISCLGCSAILHRSPDGWGYSILYPERAEADSRHKTMLWGSGGNHETQEEAEKTARFHLAQNIFGFDGPTGVQVIQDDHNRLQHLDWCKWQYCYRAWKGALPEANDNEWHRQSCFGNWPDGVEPWTWDGQS